MKELSIEERCLALGLSVKPKKKFDINNYDVTAIDDRVKLRAIVKNKSAGDLTRKLCLDVLEAYKASLEPAKGKV